MRGETKTIKREINRSLVLKCIHNTPGISRIEIARSLDLNKSTVTSIVSKLIEESIVREVSTGETSPQGGRKPVSLAVEGSFGSILGIELKHEQALAVCIDMRGNVLFKKEVRNSRFKGSMEKYFLSVYEELAAETARRNLPLLGAGIGFSGRINPYRGIVIESAAFRIEDYHFYEAAGEEVRIPLIIDNDANCCAWGELVEHTGEGSSNFLFLLPKLSRWDGPGGYVRKLGIGMGIVVNGSVYYGENFSSGEFKSVFWEQGNIEQVKAFVRPEREEVGDDGWFKDVVKEVFQNLSTIVSVFNPGTVYVGGDFGARFDEIVEIVASELGSAYIGEQAVLRLLRPADFSRFDVSRGAALMYLQRLFEVPGYSKGESFPGVAWESILSIRSGRGEG